MSSPNKVTVPLTSAVVLQYARKVYTSSLEQQYLDQINFDEVKTITDKLDTIYSHTAEIIGFRKKSVRYLIAEQLLSQPKHQVCILGAGLDPLSLYLLEHFTTKINRIIEVDGGSYLLQKQEIYAKMLPPNKDHQFIQCDLTDTALLMEKLFLAGYNPAQPTIIVFEGVIHYINNEAFIKLMQQFNTHQKSNRVIMDYSLHPDDVPPSFVQLHTSFISIFEKFVERKFNTNTRQQMLSVLSSLDATQIHIDTMEEIELRVEGHNTLLHQKGEGIIEMLAFNI